MGSVWLSLSFERLPFLRIGQLPRPAKVRQNILLRPDRPTACSRAPPFPKEGEEEKDNEEEDTVKRKEDTVERKEGRGMAYGPVHRAGAHYRFVCHRWPVQRVGWEKRRRRAPDFAADTWEGMRVIRLISAVCEYWRTLRGPSMSSLSRL